MKPEKVEQKNPSSRVMDKKKRKKEKKERRKKGRRVNFVFFFSSLKRLVQSGPVQFGLSVALAFRALVFRLQISRVSAETVHAIINGDGRRGR